MVDENDISSPTDNFWDYESLWAKTDLYVEVARQSDRETWFYPFWSVLALEFLARTALAAVSPTLLADSSSPDDDTNLLYALSLRSAGSHPKSIGTAGVYRRCEKLFSKFTGEMKKFCSRLAGLRNEELHSAASPFEDLTNEQEWLPRYYEVCSVLLGTMNKELEDLFDDEADAARKIIKAMHDKTAKQANNTINGHRTVWKEKTPLEKQAAQRKAESFAQRREGHVLDCPACGCRALLWGCPAGC